MRDRTPTVVELAPASVHEPNTLAAGAASTKPRIKKLRLALLLLGLTLLALISTAFGMMMAVASDLPTLENRAEYLAARNSIVVADDRDQTQIAKLTGNENRFLIEESDISPNMKNAIVAIEDKRFYEHEGVDYRGVVRALWQDLRQRRAAQGGSTITQQFVKNALGAQGHRSILQKLREAALSYHLEREWSKPKVLGQYLNTIYFGNGAYGIESAVRTYFGKDRADYAPDERAARDVSPAQAALLAGIIASPTAYDPLQNPAAALERRNLVLRRMLDQGLIADSQYAEGTRQSVPAAEDIQTPRPDSLQPYFTTWLTQQLVDRYGSGRVFGGGLKVTTTLDPVLQAQAERAIEMRLAGVGPSASLVAIENKTGEVKAMVGGNDFAQRPFNIATNGHRQPGSAFKPFVLITALQQGIRPDDTFSSRKKVFAVPGSPGEKFVVNNYEDQYAGVSTLTNATVHSDNSVYAELGQRVGLKRVARLSERMGIRTKVSTNPAMALGGLATGLTPLELAFAYSAIANMGERTSGSLASSQYGPVAIERVEAEEELDQNQRESKRVFSKKVAEQAGAILNGVVKYGTGERARLDEWAAGKTGTTENYGDAWFVGFNAQYTVAVWVGYPDGVKHMKTEYHGKPVTGGTFPAEIWRDFMVGAIKLRDARKPPKESEAKAPSLPAAQPATAQEPSADELRPPQETGTSGRRERPKDGAQSAPPPSPEPAPAPDEAPPPPAIGAEPEPKGGTSSGGID